MISRIYPSLQTKWKNHRSRISNSDHLREFIRDQSARICGETIMKYAQKRLGKVHFYLAKTTLEYKQDLVDCQALLHAEVLADIYYMLMNILGCETAGSQLKAMIIDLHRDYVASAPPEHPTKEYLNDKHFVREARKTADLANATGRILFAVIPASNGLLPANVAILQGQIRLSYIAFLERFGKKADLSVLQKELC